MVNPNSIPIFTNVQLVSDDQIKFDLRIPASTSTTQSIQINLSESKEWQSISLNATNSSVHVYVGENFVKGSKLIYWYLDSSKKIYGHFIANRIISNYNYF